MRIKSNVTETKAIKIRAVNKVKESKEVQKKMAWNRSLIQQYQVVVIKISHRCLEAQVRHH